MKPDLFEALHEFASSHGIHTKGKLSVVLHVTRLAMERGLPLDPADLRTSQQGQVVGLSRSSVQAILQEYGIYRTLAREGGRTSRGSLGLMEAYVRFLNSMHEQALIDLADVEAWWVERIKDFFASQPFVLRYSAGKSIRAIVRDLLEQARLRQDEGQGTMYQGLMLQHLVGAKLELLLRGKGIEVVHHGASVADEAMAQAGDYMIGSAAIHVTTVVTPGLMEKCQENLAAGYHPIIITVPEGLAAAESFLHVTNIDRDVDVIAADQFIATNLYEITAFEDSLRSDALKALIEEYNRIVDHHETDPSLRIRIG